MTSWWFHPCFFNEITPTITWGNDETIDSCCSNGLVQPPTKKSICHIFGGLAWGWNFSSSLHLFFLGCQSDVGCRMFVFLWFAVFLSSENGLWFESKTWHLTEILNWIQAVGCFYPRIRGEPVGRFIYIYRFCLQIFEKQQMSGHECGRLFSRNTCCHFLQCSGWTLTVGC